MESGWPPIVKKSTGVKAVDDFAVLIDNIQKIVFSNTLETVQWKNTRLVKGHIKEEVLKLKDQPGKPIVVGSRSILVSLMQLRLIDEYQFCMQPIVLGNGLPLFEKNNDRIDFKLLRTKTLGSGAITMYYEPIRR